MNPIEDLKKEVVRLTHVKEVLSDRIQKLSNEEIRYIDEIPKYKQMASDAKMLADENIRKNSEISKQLLAQIAQLNELKSQTFKAKSDLDAMKLETEKDRSVFNSMNNELNEKKRSLAAREAALMNREKEVDSRHKENCKQNTLIFSEKLGLETLHQEIETRNKELDSRISSHAAEKENHQKREDIFNENRKSHMVEEESLKHRMEELSAMIKENVDIKASLNIEKKKLENEINVCKEKQKTLDRNIADLGNRENLLNIKDLKIKKMAYDAGLKKELEDLEAAVK